MSTSTPIPIKPNTQSTSLHILSTASKVLSSSFISLVKRVSSVVFKGNLEVSLLLSGAAASIAYYKNSKDYTIVLPAIIATGIEIFIYAMAKLNLVVLPKLLKTGLICGGIGVQVLAGIYLIYQLSLLVKNYILPWFSPLLAVRNLMKSLEGPLKKDSDLKEEEITMPLSDALRTNLKKSIEEQVSALNLVIADSKKNHPESSKAIEVAFENFKKDPNNIKEILQSQLYPSQEDQKTAKSKKQKAKAIEQKSDEEKVKILSDAVLELKGLWKDSSELIDSSAKNLKRAIIMKALEKAVASITGTDGQKLDKLPKKPDEEKADIIKKALSDLKKLMQDNDLVDSVFKIYHESAVIKPLLPLIDKANTSQNPSSSVVNNPSTVADNSSSSKPVINKETDQFLKTIKDAKNGLKYLRNAIESTRKLSATTSFSPAKNKSKEEFLELDAKRNKVLEKEKPKNDRALKKLGQFSPQNDANSIAYIISNLADESDLNKKLFLLGITLPESKK